MSDDTERPHVFDNPRNIRLVIAAVVVACIVTVVAQLWIEVHAEHPLEGLFAFNALYGFGAFVVLVLLAKEVLRRAVMRREDYYNDE